MVPKEKIAELKRLVAESTPGLVYLDPHTSDGEHCWIIRPTDAQNAGHKTGFLMASLWERESGMTEVLGGTQKANAEKFVAAANALPDLIEDSEVLSHMQAVAESSGFDCLTEAITQASDLKEAVKTLRTAMRELITDVVIAKNYMRDAQDSKWKGCAEAIQSRIDAAQEALANTQIAELAAPKAN